MTSIWLTKYTVTPAGLAEALEAADREDAPLYLPPDEYARWLLQRAAQLDEKASVTRPEHPR